MAKDWINRSKSKKKLKVSQIHRPPGTTGTDQVLALCPICSWLQTDAKLLYLQSAFQPVTPPSLANFNAGFFEASFDKNSLILDLSGVKNCVPLFYTLSNLTISMARNATFNIH